MSSTDGVFMQDFKWPDRPYRSIVMHRLGVDEVGTWLWAGRGTISTYDGRAGEPVPVDFLTLVPSAAESWWIATWMFGGDVDLYVDVCAPPVWRSPAHLTTIDLDLDVIRWNDGRTEIDDEDEFLEHQRTYGYPPDVVAAARRCADEVLPLVAAQTVPFGSPPPRWLEIAPRSRTPH